MVRQFLPSIGGLEDAVLQLCLRLRDRGVDASVLTLDRIRQGSGDRLPGRDCVGGIPVVRVPFAGSWRYPIAPGALQHLAEAQVVHVHAIDFFFDYLALTKPFHRKPLVASTHGGFFHTDFAHRLKQLYFQSVTRLSAGAYERICASSRSDYELFRSVAGSNLHLVRNGADVEKWHDRASKPAVRQMIAIGRFAANKQFPKLLPLLQQLRQLNPDWRLVIAGRGADLTPQDLKRAIADAGLSGTVDLLVDPDNEAIGRVISRSSYLVSASRYEGFGLTAVEGMAAGLIPVLNNIDPFETLVAETGCGLLIDIDAPARSAAVIEDRHVTAGNKDNVRQRCLDVSGRYSWDDTAALFSEHYDQIARRPESQAAPC